MGCAFIGFPFYCIVQIFLLNIFCILLFGRQVLDVQMDVGVKDAKMSMAEREV